MVFGMHSIVRVLWVLRVQQVLLVLQVQTEFLAGTWTETVFRIRQKILIQMVTGTQQIAPVQLVLLVLQVLPEQLVQLVRREQMV
jgi:hypothetical protein